MTAFSLADGLIALGFAAVVIGLAHWSPAAAWIVGGAGVAAVGLLLAASHETPSDGDAPTDPVPTLDEQRHW